jgi:hypothetical protein
MDTGIHLGAEVRPEHIEAVATAITRIFTEARNTGMEQKTVRHSLDTLGRLGGIQGATISNNMVQGDKQVHLKIDKDSFDG